MRPEILNPLFVDLTALPGVGPRLAALIGKVAGPRALDVLMTAPTGVVDRRLSASIGTAEPGTITTLRVRVDKRERPERSRRPHRIICSDETGFLTLVYFHAKEPWLAAQFPEGAERIVSGKLESVYGGLQMAHPDYVADPEELDELPDMEPVYPLTAGLAPKVMRKAAAGALERAPELPEWIDQELVSREDWSDWLSAIRTLHAPRGKEDLGAASPVRKRLAYDEIFTNLLALALIRQRRSERKGRALMGDGARWAEIEKRLPFALTGAQARSVAEIKADMAREAQMVRLLQGDVGSGKTMVALAAMVAAAEAGAQSALMAPTEILARQHEEGLRELIEAAGLQSVILTGRDKGREREAKLAGIRSGYVDIIFGTHALFSGDVEFEDLGLVVVDEQHRFGVRQRLALTEKGARTDLLVMTATPIPRTLALSAYGDMEVSRLDEKPPGRKPVTTIAKPTEALDDVMAAVGRAAERGEQVYWVCPRVEAEDAGDLIAAEERADTLRAYFGDSVPIGLVHGKMPGPEKDAVMAAFYERQLSVLVATTVIEVGVNAPDATVMVIENAERFGLAQLHQLRGRVGRGSKPATCLLLYKGPLGETAKSRIETLRRTEDGFEIAEEDLALRGAGDALGAAQSGLPRFRIADAGAHQSLFDVAADDARLLVDQDPELETERGQAARIALYLHERDAAIKLLRSG